jgi:hypothetical protein
MSTGDSSLLSGHRLADKLLDHLADTVLLVGMRTASEGSQDSLPLPLVSQNGTLQSQPAGLRAAVALLALQVVVPLVELDHQAGSIATVAVGHSQKARGNLGPVVLRPNLTLHMTRAMVAMQTRMMMSSSMSHMAMTVVATTMMAVRRVMTRMSSSSVSDATMVMTTTTDVRMSSSMSHTAMTMTASSQNVNSAKHARHMSTMVDVGHASVDSSSAVVMRASVVMYMTNMMMHSVDHSSSMVVSAHVVVHMVAHVVVHSSHVMMSSHVVVSSHSSSSSSSSEQTSLDINSQGEDQDQQQEVLHYESNKVRAFFFFFFVFFFFFFPFFPYPFFQLLASTPYTSTTAKASR